MVAPNDFALYCLRYKIAGLQIAESHKGHANTISGAQQQSRKFLHPRGVIPAQLQ